jgi:hypothetical protein
VTAPDLQSRRFLVLCGVPYDVAYSLTDDEVDAECIAFGILKGGKFNWSTMAWEERQQ